MSGLQIEPDGKRWHWTLLNEDGSIRASSRAIRPDGYTSESEATSEGAAALVRSRYAVVPSQDPTTPEPWALTFDAEPISEHADQHKAAKAAQRAYGKKR